MYTKLPPSTNSLQKSQHIKNSHLKSDQGSPFTINGEWEKWTESPMYHVPQEYVQSFH